MRIALLGGGSWGTALAIHAARLHQDVALWVRKDEAAERLNRERENARYLPGIPFPENLSISADQGVIDHAELVLLAVPSGAFRETLRWMQPRLREDQTVAWATKGLETSSGAWLHEIAEEELGSGFPPALISGPSFAAEVARGPAHRTDGGLAERTQPGPPGRRTAWRRSAHLSQSRRDRCGDGGGPEERPRGRDRDRRRRRTGT